MPRRAPQPDTGWVLEGYLEGNPNLVITPITAFPFRVGRKARGGLRLPSSGVSQVHAELDHDGERLWVRDLNSTNGTYVNRRRVTGQAPVKDGDVLHFATTEFVLRLMRDDTDGEHTVHRTMDDLPQRMGGHEQFTRLLNERLVKVHFQPIVDLRSGRRVLGWEALGRGAMDELPDSPVELLDRAALVGRAQDVSELMRARAVEQARAFGPRPTLFLNCHPSELGSDRLVESMAELHALEPQAQLVLEIHEKAVGDVQLLRALTASLAVLGIHTAFDDFGAGQARLIELVDATPAYVKFDKAWTRGMEDPGSRQHKMLRTLVQMVGDFGISSVCEGVETDQQEAACMDLGFHLGQGFLFGRPQPAPVLKPG